MNKAIATVMPAARFLREVASRLFSYSPGCHLAQKTRGWHDKIIFICLLLVSIPTFALSENPYPFTSIQDEQRFSALTKEIRCVVCQNQNIADSYAPLANDLRNKVYQMVLEKKSNTEIKDYLVERYGEFILLRPSFSLINAFLWLFPLGGLVFILFFLAQCVKTRS